MIYKELEKLGIVIKKFDIETLFDNEIHKQRYKELVALLQHCQSCFFAAHSFYGFHQPGCMHYNCATNVFSSRSRDPRWILAM